MRSSAPLLLGLCAVLLAPAWGRAETRYVTDRIDVILRAGDSTRFKILKMLPSGTPLEVLAADPKGKYAQVRTADGTTGFVLAEQLQDQPAARDRAAALEQRLAEIEANPDALAARLARAQTEQADLRARYQDLEREKQRLEQENATIRRACANVLDVTNDRERLRAQVADLTRARADLEQQNRDLENQTNQRWFLIGSGVLGGGILLGLILPRVRLGRRKSAWGSL